MTSTNNPMFSSIPYKGFSIQIKTFKNGKELVQVVVVPGDSPTICLSVHSAKCKISHQIARNIFIRKQNVNI